jgi:hypothetical protein
MPQPTAPTIPDPRPSTEFTEIFRTALMKEHAHDWTMETVAEAAYICAFIVQPYGAKFAWQLVTSFFEMLSPQAVGIIIVIIIIVSVLGFLGGGRRY